MNTMTKLPSAILGGVLALTLSSVAWSEPITITPLYSGATEDLGGKHMTVLQAVLEPGAGMPPHRHPGTVYAYVVSGSVRSKLSTDDAPIVYNAGQGWIEQPGVIHEVFENPSDDGNTVVTATFIHDEGEELVLPAE